MVKKSQDQPGVETSEAKIIVVGGKQARSLKFSRKRPLLLLAAILLLVIILVAVGTRIMNRQQATRDAKVLKQHSQFVLEDTDCKKYLKQFGDSDVVEPRTEATILEASIGCAEATKEYDRALKYLDRLEKLYAQNQDLPHFVQIENTRRDIKDLQAGANSAP